HRPRTALLGERLVIGRMPVARSDDEREPLSEPVDRIDDGIAVGYRKRPPGAEVVLDVDHDQALHPGKYSPGISPQTGTIRRQLSRVLLTPEDAMRMEVHGRTDAAVQVPLYLDGEHLHAVFTKRREDLRRHPGEISFPGGRRDEDEPDLLATALREAEEEIGLPRDAVE